MTQPTEEDTRNTVPSPQQQLTTVAEKTLPSKCKNGSLLTYCPTMDLIALASEDEQLHVFRLNGQEVLSADLAGDPYLDEVKGEIRGIRWKNDGRLLAVADAENKLRIISSYTGKTVHHFSCLPHDQEQYSSSSPENSNKDAKNIRITCIGWGVNFTDSKAAQSHLREGNGQISVEDLLAPDTDPVKAALQLKADLPRELALLDVESSLPRLSTLPGSGSDEDLFSTRVSIDAIFQSFNRISSDAVDVLFVGLNDGRAHLRIFDCFEIGNFSITANKAQASTQVETLVHTSHPMSSTHAIIMSEKTKDAPNPTLKVISLDLRFITKSGRYLSLLAFKITQLQNLLRYINQTQRQIALEWKNVYELPARFMRSVADELQEKCHCDFVTALYHLVVTGNCFPPVKDFLVDIVGERGHKRWEKTVSSGYENVRRLTHECLLPALERCEVLLSRLIGISKFHKLNHILGLETRDLHEVIETLDCLHLLSHSILTKTTREMHQFMEFARWLRHEIDIQTAEPMSQTLEELLEKSDLIDHAATLDYIEGALTKSSLRRYISSTPSPAPVAGSDSQKSVADGERFSFYQTFRNTLAAEEDEKGDCNSGNKNELSRPAPPQLNDLIARLGSQCGKVFDKIALAQRRSILHHCLLVLHPDCDSNVIDTIMQYENFNEEEYAIYVTSRLRSAPNTLLIYKITIQCTNGVSSTKNISVASMRLSKGEIKQAQFVDDGTIMLLYANKDRSYLLNFYISTSSSDADETESFPQYTTTTDLQSLPTPFDLDIFGHHADIIIHTFPTFGPKSKPIRMNVNGRKERRAACILSADMMRYEVLDIDHPVESDSED
ncbi:anaphase-promoting complex component Cut20/Apc4, putative [Talaromyces stipitatus ATCC 10500]|uniref:Anaphase-promoting complex subunit 4 n=1 Tax=Talaromyces stipitatus (strain ATCC 10500 / CBS 375.48 / QM 6759 / NRRL 1006) TaxID=441959 RepID=B8M1X7_TALSN|nr:anaphase-promoting complex component Cut20/Apc4, putative [Talaromyces stipitatus ATCC 10500]EED21355.1 anaphase-promoting complex component Cut20/Apc4, putative [Talaromyces stipitatus ATCC 10500]